MTDRKKGHSHALDHKFSHFPLTVLHNYTQQCNHTSCPAVLKAPTTPQDRRGQLQKLCAFTAWDSKTMPVSFFCPAPSFASFAKKLNEIAMEAQQFDQRPLQRSHFASPVDACKYTEDRITSNVVFPPLRDFLKTTPGAGWRCQWRLGSCFQRQHHTSVFIVHTHDALRK